MLTINEELNVATLEKIKKSSDCLDMPPTVRSANTLLQQS